MIIFYQKSTGLIIGTVEGRVHPKEHQDIKIVPDNINESDIGVYVVPLKERRGMKDIPVFDWVPEHEGSPRYVKKQVGVRQEEKVLELVPDGPLAKVVLATEKGLDSLYNYRLVLDNNEVRGLQQISPESAPQPLTQPRQIV